MTSSQRVMVICGVLQSQVCQWHAHEALASYVSVVCYLQAHIPCSDQVLKRRACLMTNRSTRMWSLATALYRIAAEVLVLFCCCCLSQREMAMIPPAEISLKDIASHCEVKTSCLDEEVTSAYYHEVSRYLSKWKLIAPKLKFTDDEIESIDQDNLTAEMKRISFVKEWKQKFAMKATYRALMHGVPPGHQEGAGRHGCVSGLKR